MKGTDMKHSRSKSTLFILPMLFSRYDVLNKDFLNAYIFNDKHIEKELLAIVYKKSNLKLQRYSPYTTEVHGSIVIYFFDIKHLEPLIKDFINGNYSQFTSTAKARILKFWGVNKASSLYNILYPIKLIGVTPEEVFPKPIIKHETLNLRSFKSYA